MGTLLVHTIVAMSRESLSATGNYAKMGAPGHGPNVPKTSRNQLHRPGIVSKLGGER
jgi:hypothetical protein